MDDNTCKCMGAVIRGLLVCRGQDTYKNSSSHVGTPEANFNLPHQIPVAHLTINFFYENLTTHDTFTDSESIHFNDACKAQLIPRPREPEGFEGHGMLENYR